MRTDPAMRVDINAVRSHPVVSRTREAMECIRERALAGASSGNVAGPGAMFCASPLAAVPEGFLEEILGRTVGGVEHDETDAMDLS